MHSSVLRIIWDYSSSFLQSIHIYVISENSHQHCEIYKEVVIIFILQIKKPVQKVKWLPQDHTASLCHDID